MQSRRQFINTLARGSILASLTLLSGILMRRWSEADDCNGNYVCGNCKLSNHCELPEAKKYKVSKMESKKTIIEDGRNRK